MKVASFVTGVLSLVFSFIPLLGCILAIVAICTARYESQTISGMSAAGLTCGIVGLSLNVIFSGIIGCSIYAA